MVWIGQWSTDRMLVQESMSPTICWDNAELGSCLVSAWWLIGLFGMTVTETLSNWPGQGNSKHWSGWPMWNWDGILERNQKEARRAMIIVKERDEEAMWYGACTCTMSPMWAVKADIISVARICVFLLAFLIGKKIAAMSKQGCNLHHYHHHPAILSLYSPQVNNLSLWVLVFYIIHWVESHTWSTLNADSNLSINAHL